MTLIFMESEGYVYDLCALYRALPVVLKKNDQLAAAFSIIHITRPRV